MLACVPPQLQPPDRMLRDTGTARHLLHSLLAHTGRPKMICLGQEGQEPPRSWSLWWTDKTEQLSRKDLMPVQGVQLMLPNLAPLYHSKCRRAGLEGGQLTDLQGRFIKAGEGKAGP